MAIAFVLYFVGEVLEFAIDPYAQFVLAAFVPVSVFVVITILKDCHEAVNSNAGAFFGKFFLLVGVVMVVLLVIDFALEAASPSLWRTAASAGTWGAVS